MRSMWNAADRAALKRRIAQLSPDRRPSWGRMSAPQMVCHLIDSVRMGTGDVPVAGKHTPLRYFPLKQLVIYWLPWPKDVPTAPELLVRQPRDWSTDTAELSKALEEFAARDVNSRFPEHPAFGPLTGRQWGALVWRHVDHHLRQFSL